MTIEGDAHGNFVDFTRWLPTLEPAGIGYDDHGVVAFAGVADWPSSRFALRSREGDLAGERWVEAAEAFLGARGSTACMFVREGVDDDLVEPLVARGYGEYQRSPEMVCDGRLPDVPAPDGVTLRLAATAQDVTGYAAVAGEAFAHLGMLREPLQAQLDNPDALLDDRVAVAVAELDGRIVAGAMSALVGERPNGYVGWVACADLARGRGLGDLVTRAVTNAAFDRGAAMVSLEASAFGENTYRRMGYRELYRYRILVRI